MRTKPGVLIVAVLLLAGCRSCDSARNKSNNEFAGLVDIGKRKIYIECRGTGSPTVVFVAGLQDRAETWSKTRDPSEPAVLPSIASTTRVCAYDRPGTVLIAGEDFEKSRSDPVPQPITSADAVADLHALLTAIGERGPYVLVGHSAGGAFSSYYASEYPQDVSGLVLVDYLPYGLRNGLTDAQWEIWKKLNSPSQEALEEYPALERLDHQRSLEQLLAAAPLKAQPLVVLSADRPYDLTPYVDDGRLPDVRFPKEFADVLFRAVLAARANLASHVPGAKHITNTNSGHYIHQEQPQLVIDVVREVVEAVRKGSRQPPH